MRDDLRRKFGEAQTGTNYDISNRLRFDAQFRLINETGFGFSVGYLF